MLRIASCVLALSISLAALSCSGGQTAPPKGEAEYIGDAATDIFAAIRAGDGETAARLLKEDPTLADAIDENGWTPLHAAVMSNRPDMVVMLVENGIDPNVSDANGDTPLAALENSGLRAEQARKAILAAGGTA
jgi:hypothetical protein